MKYVLILFIIFLPLEAKAQQTLNFKVAKSFKEKQITSFVSKNTNIDVSSFILAPIDLNEDAIDEYIVKPNSRRLCNDSLFCKHHIIALQDREPIQIGQFDAHKVLISNKNTYGIRDIIIYNNQYNDFKSEIASWSPSKFLFGYN